MEKITLNNGTRMPPIGFGVFRIPDGEEVKNAVMCALRTGYRHIDTAMIYENEEGVGEALRESGIPREEIFLTTKLWNLDQGYESALKAIDVSLKKLGVEYVDLYLVHWPTASIETDVDGNYRSDNKRAETWKAMEVICASGKAKAIGVSNYTIVHLEEMKQYMKIPPAVNQFEFHPFLYQKELLAYCKAHDIVVEAHSPLANGMSAENEIINAVAKKYNKSNSQIMIRWSIQHGAIPLPKSVHKERIQENFNVFDFEISDEEMEMLDGLNINVHVRRDPTNLK